MEWRSIETAPREGIFWGKVGADAIAMEWIDEDGYRGFTSGWARNGRPVLEMHKPSHWMPIPPDPPAAEDLPLTP